MPLRKRQEGERAGLCLVMRINMEYVYQTALLLVGVYVGLPVLSYMLVKFGTAGYFKAKERYKK